jgi:hypothetical protein
MSFGSPIPADSARYYVIWVAFHVVWVARDVCKAASCLRFSDSVYLITECGYLKRRMSARGHYRRTSPRFFWVS